MPLSDVPTFPFLSLPQELLILIFIPLDLCSILRCRLLSRFCKSVVDGSVDLQYQIELSIHGMVDNPSCPLPTLRRLEMLQEHCDVWSGPKLKLPPAHTITMNKNVWELSGGILAEALPRPQGRDGPGARGIQFSRLSSPRRGINPQVWTTKFDVEIRDFTFDPSQDLVAIIQTNSSSPGMTRRIHLRSVRAGGVHPLAAKPGFVEHDIGGTPGSFRFSWTVKISGDYLASLSLIQDGEPSETVNHLRVWNWKLGTSLLRLDDNKYTSMAFLPNSNLLVTVADWQGGRYVSQLAIYTLGSVYGDGELAPQVLLNLPEYSRGALLLDMSLYSDPPIAPASCGDNWSPFSISPNARTFVVTLAVASEGQQQLHVYNIFIPLAALQPFLTIPPPTKKCNWTENLASPCNIARSPGSSSPQSRVLDWDAWGPNGTRMFKMKTIEPVWVCFIHGTRFATMSLDSRVQLFEFNQLALRLQLQRFDHRRHVRASLGVLGDVPISRNEDDHTQKGRGTEPSIIKEGNIFANVVITNLSYQMSTTDLDNGYRGIMLTGDHLIAVDPIHNQWVYFPL